MMMTTVCVFSPTAGCMSYPSNRRHRVWHEEEEMNQCRARRQSGMGGEKREKGGWLDMITNDMLLARS